jgi:hypothetical protein
MLLSTNKHKNMHLLIRVSAQLASKYNLVSVICTLVCHILKPTKMDVKEATVIHLFSLYAIYGVY